MEIHTPCPRWMQATHRQPVDFHLSCRTNPSYALPVERQWFNIACFPSRSTSTCIGTLQTRQNFEGGCMCSLFAVATAIESLSTLADAAQKLPSAVERRKMPAIDSTASSEPPCTPMPPSRETPLYNPSNRLVIYFRQLGLMGTSLDRCLKHVFDMTEEDVMKLMGTFRSCELRRIDLRSIIIKYPSLVKVKGSQVEQIFRYFSSLRFSKADVIRILVKRPALFDCDMEAAIQIIEYLLSTGIEKGDLRVVLSKRPQILEQNVGLVKSAVSALLKAKISQADCRTLLKREPAILTPSVEESRVQDTMDFLLSVGLEAKDLCRALLRRPHFLSYDLPSMRSTYRYLQGLMQPQDLTKAVKRYAELLSIDPENKLEPLINYFLRLGVKEEDIGKVILKRPQITKCTMAQLERTVEYLKNLGVKETTLGKMIIASPQVFTLNAEDKLKRGVDFFRSIGLDKDRDMAIIFSRNAQIFCCSIEKNLRPKFEFFLSTGLSKEATAEMIVRFPTILGQSMEHSLTPKYEYLVVDMKRTVQELVDFPQYFGYSLENRIKPRHKQLSERGICTSLPSMLACTDTLFCRRYLAQPYVLSQTISKHEEQVT